MMLPVKNSLINGETLVESFYYRNHDSSMPCVDDGDCSEFHFETHKTHQMRLVNASAGGN